MNEYIKDTIMAGVCAAALFVIGVLCGMRVKNSDIKREAIAQGHAIYNATNGNFQWKELEVKPTITFSNESDDIVIHITNASAKTITVLPPPHFKWKESE